ncbi:MAG TPA: hypothetical protein VEY94_02540, partial [Patescibacteria group bacterium]|nr:hypothetical protein [Patescibacteria group bacterium]
MATNGSRDDDATLAHKHCRRNRAELRESEICGCFYCLEIFEPSEITRWTDEIDAPQSSAICPKCRIDSVIGSRSGYPITHE